MTSLVAPVVGGLGAPAGANPTTPDVGDGYDFAIGGMGFHLAISDERVYERATAQFRKEQFDTSENPGDQSLVGFWTRGQLSFHEGAGVRYADAQAGLTDNRYWSSAGVNPFVKGEATLYPAWAAATPDSFTGITDCLPVGDKIAVLDSGTITYGAPGAAGTDYPASGSSIGALSIATGGGNIYAAMSDKTIHRIGLSLTYPLVYSTGFETGTDGWTQEGGATIATSTSTPFEGSNKLVITPPASVTFLAGSYKRLTGLTVGKGYTLVANVFLPTGAGGKVRPDAFGTGAGAAIATEGAWTEVSYNFTATATELPVGFITFDGGVPPFSVDKVRVYENTRTGYDDGSTPAEAIYSHTKPLTEVHYAKDRLFVMDSSGDWYQLAPNPSAALPVAIASSSKVFSVSTSGRWAVCDTPGPVLLANGSRVFAVTQNSDGLFPTLTAPIQVADLPEGEDVTAMAHYLGYVVLVTTRGVRVAILGDSGITYGPRLLEWTDSVRHTGIARAGESVYVTGDHRIIEVNLGSQIEDSLEFGWADLPSPFSSETNYGVSQFDNKVIAWGGSTLDIQQATVVDSGTLQTSYHRFGTLEPKKFHTVKVRMQGKGQVAIAKVDRNGSVFPLHTVDASDEEVEVTLRADAPSDRLALQFTLLAEGGESPKLLSYQLRALPAPKRQRMIRVPLALHDVERRGVTRAKGHDGSAWERLSALEEMEQNGGMVMFQDFRTGESGLCYIEQVAHEGRTSPGRQAKPFGGFVFVTLRKI